MLSDEQKRELDLLLDGELSDSERAVVLEDLESDLPQLRESRKAYRRKLDPHKPELETYNHNAMQWACGISLMLIVSWTA